MIQCLLCNKEWIKYDDSMRLNLKRISIRDWILFFAILSTSLRAYLFFNYFTFHNDDLAYFVLADNLLTRGFYSSDGANYHYHYPPIYPVFIAGLKLLNLSNESIKFINNVLLVNLICILILKVLSVLKKRITLVYVSITFLNPIFIIGNVTLDLSVEILYSVLVLLGLLFIIHSYTNNSLITWHISIVFICLAFLTREEGIFFLFWHVLILITKKWETKELKNYLLSFCLLAIPTVLLWSVYVSTQSGQFAISGKLLPKEGFSSRWGDLNIFQGIADSFITLFFSPLFTSPIITLMFLSLLVRYMYFVYLKKLGRLFSQGPLFPVYIFVTPLLLLIILFAVTNPLARAMYILNCLILILLFYLHEIIRENSLKEIHKRQSLVFSTIPLFMSITLLMVFTSNRLDTSASDYVKATRQILHYEKLSAKESIKIYSRAVSVSLIDSRIKVCNLDISCNKPNYFILSDSRHVSLLKMSFGEWNSASKREQEYNNCKLIDTWNSKHGVILLYRCPMARVSSPENQ